MIFLHPSSLLFLILLGTTIVMILSADSWLMMWLFLEINLLLFTPLLFSKKSKYQSEAALKYFINQAMSSILILSAITFLSSSFSESYNTLCFAFGLKMGVAPLHGWLVTVASSISWFSLWLLLIPQKIAPMLVTGVLINSVTFTLFLVMIIVSSLVGALGGLTTPSMKKIITYSSVAQMGWLLSALVTNSTIWVGYFIIYSAITSIIMLTLTFTKTNKMNDLLSSKNKIMKAAMMINMLSMAGLPPFSGFMMKTTLIFKMSENMKPILLGPLVLASLVSLYFYTRIFYANMILTTTKKLEENKSFNEKTIISLNLASLPLGLMVLL